MENSVNQRPVSWLGRMWRTLLMFGEAMDISDTELLERRIAALEAAVAKAEDRALRR